MQKNHSVVCIIPMFILQVSTRVPVIYLPSGPAILPRNFQCGGRSHIIIFVGLMGLHSLMGMMISYKPNLTLIEHIKFVRH